MDEEINRQIQQIVVLSNPEELIPRLQKFVNDLLEIQAKATQTQVVTLPSDNEIEDEAHKAIIDYLTDNNPNEDFKHSTIGADDNKNWWVMGAKWMRARLSMKPFKEGYQVEVDKQFQVITIDKNREMDIQNNTNQRYW